MNKTMKLGCFVILACAAACTNAEAPEATAESELVSEIALTEADFPSVDCRAACPGAVTGASVGSLSGKRVAAVQFRQEATCAASTTAVPDGLHTKRAGEPCSLGATPAHGQPLSGDAACEEFECAETGSLRASACIAPTLTSASSFRIQGGQCATKALACAAAREAVARRDGQQLCL